MDFKEYTLNEMVDTEKLYDALHDTNKVKAEEFTQAMYDWFEANYADAVLYAGDDTPDDFIEYLELKKGKKLRDFYVAMKKKGFV